MSKRATSSPSPSSQPVLPLLPSAQLGRQQLLHPQGPEAQTHPLRFSDSGHRPLAYLLRLQLRRQPHTCRTDPPVARAHFLRNRHRNLLLGEFPRSGHGSA